MIRFECVNYGDSYTSNNDRYTLTSLSSTVQNNYAAASLSYTTSTGSVSYSTFTYNYDYYMIKFKSNVYTANFYTGGKALIQLEGAPRVIFESESFTNNGDMAKEVITKYGTGILVASGTELTIPSGISSPGSYSSTTLGQSLITVKRSIYFKMSSMSYNNNW